MTTSSNHTKAFVQCCHGSTWWRVHELYCQATYVPDDKTRSHDYSLARCDAAEFKKIGTEVMEEPASIISVQKEYSTLPP
jgi:hypothetical protein